MSSVTCKFTHFLPPPQEISSCVISTCEPLQTSLCPGPLENSWCVSSLKERKNLKHTPSFQQFKIFSCTVKCSDVQSQMETFFKSMHNAGGKKKASMNSVHLKDFWVSWTSKKLNSLRSLICFKQVQFSPLSLRLNGGFVSAHHLALSCSRKAGSSEVGLHGWEFSGVHLEFEKPDFLFFFKERSE